MTSPRDMPVLSSSPVSVIGSPIARRRRDSSSETEAVDTSSRSPRPSYPRSFDPIDPESRERQRTMDVDMALQLSRARRDTIAAPSPLFEPVHRTDADADSAFVLPFVSDHRDLGGPPDGMLRTTDRELVDGVPDDPMHLVTPRDIDYRHLDTGHNHTLIDTLEGRYPQVPHEASASLSGLPSYQANLAHPAFDFTVLETFSSTEKANLGITSPLGAAPPKPRQSKPPGVDDEGEPSSSLPSGLAPGEPTGGQIPSSPASRMNVRHRRLSQSTPPPRPRRGIRRKIALFEGQNNEPTPGFTARFMGQLSTVPSSENLSTDREPYTSARFQDIGGIMSPADDRPYRFSFYSNALSATIHARSLCELPAEGQTFEELFSSVPIPLKQRDVKGTPPFFSNHRCLSVEL